jgi:hypothetical protein
MQNTNIARILQRTSTLIRRRSFGSSNLPAGLNIVFNWLTEEIADSLLPVIDEKFADTCMDDVAVFLAKLFINIFDCFNQAFQFNCTFVQCKVLEINEIIQNMSYKN